MTRRGYFIRLAICVAVDVADFTLGRVPVVGSVGEGAGAALLFLLWGWPGLVYLGELADPSEQLDGFLSTATLIALSIGVKQGYLFGKPSGASPARKSGS
ncbi:MAG: hypothetical protein NW200_13990 [Hyphomonadaceae bacterium]|nr:hypothetical protein [Hyphomonadaceae bacterium]